MINTIKKRFALVALLVIISLLFSVVFVACNDSHEQVDAVYTITFDPNYDGATPQTYTLKANEIEGYLTPSRDGYTFLGWTIDKEGNTPFNKYSVVNNMTIYAQWQRIAQSYTVTFRDSEGNVIGQPQIVEEGESAVAPIESEYASFIPSGYRFVRWDKSFDNVTSNLDVNMVIAEIGEVVTYTVRFYDSTGSDLIAVRTVNEGESAVAPPASMLQDYIPQDYVFVGWSKSLDNVTSNLTVLMLIERSVDVVTVTFKNGEDTIASFEGKPGNGIPQKIDIPDNLGFEFARFETEDGKVFGEDSVFSENETYYAVWAIATPDAPTIVKDAESYTYGQSFTLSLDNKVEYASLNYTYEWLDSDNHVVFTGEEYVASNVSGTHVYSVRVIASLEGYESKSSASRTINVVVNKAILNATVQNTSVTYGDSAPQAFDIVYTGFVFDDDESVVNEDNLSFVCGYTLGNNIGNYPVSASGASATNYDINYINGSVAVSPKQISVSKDDSATYNYVPFSKQYTISNNGLLDGHTLTVTLTTSSENVGVYSTADTINGIEKAISIVDANSQNVLANYDVIVNATIEITPKTIDYALPINTTFTYDANSHFASITDVTDDIPVLYSVDNANFSQVAPSFTNAGTYTVYAKISKSNFVDVATSYTIIINSAPVTIEAQPLAVTYGQAFRQSDLTYTTTLNGNFDITISTDYIVGMPVGEYAIEVSASSNSNYQFTIVNSTLTVTKATLSVVVDNNSITYGDDFTPSFSDVQIDGIYGDDDAMLTLSTTYNKGDNVGKYDITCTCDNTNYTLSLTKGELTVAKRDLTVSLASQSVTYGTAHSALQYSITQGSLADGDNLSVVDTTSYVVGNNVGSYPITANVTIDNGKQDNYNITVNDATLTVNQYNITVTLAKPANIVYGDNAPALSYTLDKDVVSGDTIVVDYLHDYIVGSNVDTYNVGANVTFNRDDKDMSANYSLTINSTSFDVTTRFVTITMSTPSPSMYGEPLNAIGYSITDGLFASCDEVVITPSHADATNVGRYTVGATIIIDGNVYNEDNANYNITVVSSSFEVTARPVTVTLNSANLTYGEDFEAIATIDEIGFASGDSVIVTPTTTYTAGANIGQYKVSASITIGGMNYTSNNNYDITIVDGQVDVSPALLTVSANDVADIIYGDSVPHLSYTLEGGAIALDTLTITTTTLYTQGANVGVYDVVNNITITRDDVDVSANYSLTNNKTTLKVNARTINVTLPDLVVTYGDSLTFPMDQVSIDNLYSDDSIEDVISVTFDYTSIVSKPMSDSGAKQVILKTDNYVLGSVDLGSLTINKKPISITIDNKSSVYGDAAPEYTYSSSDTLVGADRIASFSPNVAVGDVMNTVGNFDIDATFVIKSGDEDVTYCYDISKTLGTLTVSPRAITITYQKYHKQDGNKASFDITNDMVSNEHSKDTFTGTFTTVNYVNGIYALVPSEIEGTLVITDENGAVSLDNYIITYDFNIEIAASEFGCTATSYQGVYDGNAHTGSVTPAVDGVTITYGMTEGTYDLNEIPSFTNAGNYTVYFKATKAEMTDYLGSFTVSISKKSATLALNKTLTYGDSYEVPSLSAISGLDTRDILELNLTMDVDGYSNGANAGTYAVTFTYSDVNNNYDLTNNGGAIVVNKMAFLVTFDSADYDITYGEAFTMPTYTVSSDLAHLVSVSTLYTAGSNVGTYTIDVVNSDETNYSMSVANLSTINVSPRVVYLNNDLTAIELTYGETVTKNPQDISSSMYANDVYEVTGFTVPSTLDVGEYDYSFSLTINGLNYAENSNYSIINKTVKVTVKAKAISLTADDKNIIYNDDAPIYTFSTNIDAINGDVISATLTCEYTKGSDVGNYTIVVSSIKAMRDDVDKSKNYSFTSTNGTLKVTKRAINATFEDYNVEYGDSVDINSLVTVDASYLGSVITFNTTYTSTSPAGEYEVGYTMLNSNYICNATLGKIIVSAKTITVTIGNASVTYGDTLVIPSYSTSVIGAKAYLSVTSTYTQGANAGSVFDYTITLNSAANGKYVLDLENSSVGQITVTKKTIVVTPDDLTKQYDGIVPTITYSMTSLYGSDTLDITFSGIDNVNVGTYTVRANVIENTNYVIDNSNSATLTITPCEVVVNVADVSIPFNSAVGEIPFTVNKEFAREYVVITAPTYSVGSNVGTYPLQVSLLANDNLVLSENCVVGNLIVKPTTFTISITIPDTSITYGDTLVLPSFTTDSQEANDYLVVSTTYVVGSGVGEYQYILSSSNANCAFTVDKATSSVGKVTVSPAQLTITLNQVDPITYGDDVPSFSATIDGAKNGELDALYNALVFGTAYQKGNNASLEGYDYYLNVSETKKAAVFANYTFATPASLKLIVNKVDSVPSDFSIEGITTTYTPTLTLASLSLPSGFEWEDSATLVGDAGVHTFYARYIGDTNHNACNGVAVSVTVLKAGVTVQGTNIAEADYVQGSTQSFPLNDFVAMYGDVDVTSLGSFKVNGASTFSTGEAGTFGFLVAFDSTNYAGSLKCYLKVKSVDFGGTLYTIEDALYIATSGTIKLTVSTSFADEENSCYGDNESYYTLKGGVTLLLPYSSTDTTGWLGAGTSGSTAYDSHPSSNGTPTLYINLTIPQGVNIVANGDIIVGAITGSKVAGSQQNKVSGAYSQITLDGTLTTNSCTLRVMGYIKGTGSITTNSTTVIENLYLSGWVGGTISTARYAGNHSIPIGTIVGGKDITIDNPNMFPFNQYELRSIQTTMTLNHGSKLQGYTKIATSAQSAAGGMIKVDAQINEATLTFVTNSSAAADGIIRSTSGAKVVKSIVDGRLNLDLYGTFNDGYTSMSMIVIGCTATMSSQKVIFPIDGLTNINLKSGATFNQAYKYKMLPGARLTVDSGATYNLNGTLVMYEKSFTDISTYPYPGATRGDSILTVNGTMNLNGAFGGNVVGTGTLNVGNSATITSVKSIEGTGSGKAETGFLVNAKYVFTFTEQGSVTRNAQANGVDVALGTSYPLA